MLVRRCTSPSDPLSVCVHSLLEITRSICETVDNASWSQGRSRFDRGSPDYSGSRHRDSGNKGDVLDATTVVVEMEERVVETTAGALLAAAISGVVVDMVTTTTTTSTARHALRISTLAGLHRRRFIL